MTKLSDERSSKEADLVAKTYLQCREAQNELYNYCREYFERNYKGIFFIGAEASKEIFQESFIKLWENIEARKIYSEDYIVKGKNGYPLKGSILTYLMGIARLKYFEYVRENKLTTNVEISTKMHDKIEEYNQTELIDILYGNSTKIQEEIIADLISKMSTRCNEILTKFYYEKKTFDMILLEIPSINSKDGLKEKKYKCIRSIRNSAQNIYKRYLTE